MIAYSAGMKQIDNCDNVACLMCYYFIIYDVYIDGNMLHL